MKLLFAVVSLIVLAFSVAPIAADECYDYGEEISWSCPYSCCYDYDYCCNNDFAAVYWYIWVIIVIFILLCVCACVGGGYGYRRHYVRRVYYQQVPPTTTVVTTTANQGYGYQSTPPAYNPNVGGYQQAPPKY